MLFTESKGVIIQLHDRPQEPQVVNVGHYKSLVVDTLQDIQGRPDLKLTIPTTSVCIPDSTAGPSAQSACESPFPSFPALMRQDPDVSASCLQGCVADLLM